jgi:acetyl-CoA carboxylase biotin carboxyl carrier protein
MNQKKEDSGSAAPGESQPGAACPPLIDVQQIRNLIELMVENDLSRLELRAGDTHILLRRGQPVLPGAYAPQAAPPPAPAPAPSAPVAAENEILIRSPMVGTFYAAAEPDAPPFVTVGTTVNPNSVVCLLEAMKVFNEIKAEVSGRITKVLARNGQAVEFDQPLFAVAPA